MTVKNFHFETVTTNINLTPLYGLKKTATERNHNVRLTVGFLTHSSLWMDGPDIILQATIESNPKKKAHTQLMRQPGYEIIFHGPSYCIM